MFDQTIFGDSIPVASPVQEHLGVLIVGPGPRDRSLWAKYQLHPRAVRVDTPGKVVASQKSFWTASTLSSIPRIPTNLSPMPSWPLALSLICIPCPWHADKPITAGADLQENKYEQKSSGIKEICLPLPRVSKQLLEPILTRDPSWTFGGSFGY